MEYKRLESEQSKLLINKNKLAKTKEDLNSSLYECSITQSYTMEPYLCNCGCGSLFDKTAISKWLTYNSTCPISRNNIRLCNMTQDRTRKNKVEELLDTINKLEEEIIINNTNIRRYTDLLNATNKSLDFISYNKIDTEEYSYYQITTDECNPITQTIYFLVDTSYSMNTLINIKGSEINHSISFLDLVKHAIGVFCKLLENNHYVEICIIKFSSNSKVLFEPQYITSDNMDSIQSKIGDLRPDGQTNIYSAFLKAFEYIKNSDNYSNIVLLTDGIPTKEFTPNGLDKHTFKSIEKHNLFDKISINTIGLGYNLEIDSLCSLSSKTNGSYFYMPESSLVGPTIIHLLINLTTKCCKSVSLTLTYKDSSDLIDLTDNLELFTYTIFPYENKLKINLGSMNESQQLVIKLKNKKPINVQYTCDTYDISYKNTEIDINTNSLRLDTTYKLSQIYNNLNKNIYRCESAKKELDLLIKNMKDLNQTDFYSKDFIEDISDQIYKGLTNNEYFSKWGKFFIPSIIQFHNKKICPNFIQPGLQHYKNEKMADLAEDYHEIFCTYEPPVSSKPTPQIQYRSNIPVYNNNNYNTNNNINSNTTLYRTISNAGCFHGDSLVQISRNNYKKISDLKKNDRVLDTTGQESIIQCVIVFPCNETACLSELPGGLKITPYHPIKINNIWKFPIDIVGAKNINCNKVYNFVLNTRRSIIVNNVECCTLAHNMVGNVIEHDFFGTDKIIDNLKMDFRQGWDLGYIDNITKIIRSPNTNNIIRYEK